MVAVAYLILIASDYTVTLLTYHRVALKLNDALCVVRALAKLATDFYIFAQFYSAMNFFIAKKLEISKAFSCKERLIVAMIRILWGLSICACLI